MIELLLNFRDEKTGKNPFYLILKREDARILGLYEASMGDIIYAVKPGYGDEHGQQLPTAKLAASAPWRAYSLQLVPA